MQENQQRSQTQKVSTILKSINQNNREHSVEGNVKKLISDFSISGDGKRTRNQKMQIASKTMVNNNP